jgi:hypothetical protein
MEREEAISEWTFRSNHIKKWLDEYGEEPSIRHYVELIDMAIEALQTELNKAVPPSLADVYKWERDVALSQLEEYGIGFGEKKRDDLLEVVRCKDCQYQEHCYKTVAHNKRHDDFNEYWSEPIEFCSRGKRREP